MKLVAWSARLHCCTITINVTLFHKLLYNVLLSKKCSFPKIGPLKFGPPRQLPMSHMQGAGPGDIECKII